MARKKKCPARIPDSISVIREKIKAVKSLIELFGYEECSHAGDLLYSSDCLEEDSSLCTTFLQLKLQLLTLYSFFMELGMSNEVMRRFIDKVGGCLGVDDPYYSLDNCFRIGYLAAPFWHYDTESNYWLYGKEDGDYDGPGEDMEERVKNVLEAFHYELKAVGCSDEVANRVYVDPDVYETAATEYYYMEEIEADFFFIRSELLPYYDAFVKNLSTVERRKLMRRKLVKELEDILSQKFSNLHPCTRYCERMELFPGVFIFAVGDENCQCDFARSQLCANYSAGMYASMIDLYLFMLDEEFHFLPKEYAGRSNEIFPDFVPKKAVKAVKTA